MVVGEAIIKTTVDNSGLDDGLKELQDNLKEAEKEVEYFENELKNLSSSAFSKEEIEDNLEFWKDSIEHWKKSIAEFNAEGGINPLGNKQEALQEIKSKFGDVLSDIGTKITGLGKTTLSMIKSIVKFMATSGILLLVMSILAVVMLIVGAFAKLVNKNEELKTKLQYLGFVLKQMFANLIKLFEPIAEFLIKLFEKLINIVFKVLTFIGGVIKAITGKNIFKNTGVGDFEKSLKGADKSAKSLQKTLVGFDEANILGGGTTGVGVASQLKGLEDMLNLEEEVDKKGQKIREWFTRPITKKGIMQVIGVYENFFKSVGGWINDKLVQPYIDGVKTMVKESEWLWRPVWDYMVFAFGPAVEQLKKNWDEFLVYLQPAKTFLQKIFQPVVDVWNYVLDNYLKPAWYQFYNSLPEPVRKVLDTVWGWFKKIYNDIAFYLNNLGIKIPYIVDETTTSAETGAKKVKNAVSDANNEVNKLSNKKINIGVNTTSLNKLSDLLDNIVLNVQALTGKKITINTWTTKANPSAKGSIIYPKLAMGGIVNMPGRGAMYNGATIGERGAEAILPLTDSQQMALLGEAIGKYVTINANMNNYMNGRLISREIQKIQNQTEFAINR